MVFFRRPIAISLSPNVEKSDIILAFRLLFSPWYFYSDNFVSLLENWFKTYFGVKYAVSFESGRSTLFAILEALGLGYGDEVILQAFTCVAVPNAIIARGAKPIYADIDSSYTLDVKDVKRKITRRTKGIIVQHTFGIPAKINAILKIADMYRLFVIEDSAHIIGRKYSDVKLGNFTHAAFFSFGRDKAFSSVWGGMAITNNKILGNNLMKINHKIKNPSIPWIIRQIFHPIAFLLIMQLYEFMNIGKIIIVMLQKVNVLSLPVSKDEKKGKMNKNIFKMPNHLAAMALFQVSKIEKYNSRRKKIAKLYFTQLKSFRKAMYYKSNAIFLRFPIRFKNKKNLLQNAKKNNIYLGNWYENVIDPKGVNFDSVFYNSGTCLNAEKIASQVVNLPTYPTMSDEDVNKVISLIKSHDIH